MPCVFANPFPNSGSLYQDVRDNSLRRLPERTTPSLQSGETTVPEVSSERLSVSHVVVYGNTELTADEMSGILAPYSQRELSADEIREAANALQREYRRRGLFTARVYVPPQAVADGVLTLHVYEGMLEESGVGLRNDGENVRDGVVDSILAANIATGALMRTPEFERAILLVDDIPGITSHSIIYPGSEVGSAKFLMTVEDTDSFTGNVDFDNFGNYYTGGNRGGATLYFNSPTGSGDQVTVRLVTSGADYNYAFLDYSIPVSGRGTRVGANVDWLDYELGKEFQPLGADGRAESARLFAAHPFVRSRHGNLSGRLEYAYLRLEDDDSTGRLRSDRRINALSLSLSGDHDDDLVGNGVTYFGLVLTAGELDILGGDAARDFDARNVGAEGSFARLGLDVSRLQHLGGRWSTFLDIEGQWASGNLDVSQKFYIGGPFSVPGYPTGEASGDHGARVHADVRRDFPGAPWGGDFQLSLFYTAGWVQLHAETWPGWEGGNPVIENDITLESWGIAASQTWPSGVVARASVGRQVGENAGRDPLTGEDSDRSDSDYRGWIQVIYYF